MRVLDHNGDRRILDNRIQESARLLQLTGSLLLVADVLVRRKPSSAGHRPVVNEDFPAVRRDGIPSRKLSCATPAQAHFRNTVPDRRRGCPVAARCLINSLNEQPGLITSGDRPYIWMYLSLTTTIFWCSSHMTSPCDMLLIAASSWIRAARDSSSADLVFLLVAQ